MKTEVIRLFGIVQGVGFRPFVSRTAKTCRICGSVCNKGSYVEVIAQGDDAARQQFHRDLIAKAPARSSILNVSTTIEDRKPYTDFTIIESAKEKGAVFVSPDIAICDECKKELFDKTNRRYLHPFINCTACGPRLTILDAMPYDRERTSMGEFPMCDACHEEYTHPETRRYDAQPVCCNDCGPEVYLLGRKERRREAICKAREVICRGGIIAVKGIGGFHLCCDAANDDALQRLRRLKHRPVKPFAVMMKDLAVVKRECVVSPEQEALLDGHEKPIILLRKRAQTSLSSYIAPDNPNVGVMLPYTPLHLLLFTYDDDLVMPDALVMTSANASGAPICRTDEDVKTEVLGMCDLVLSHTRKIRLRADDSVMDFYDGKPYMIRRSRGYAPLPFFAGTETGRQVLAIGGELKNTFCIGKDNLYYLSPYIGDMADIRTVTALRESVTRMETLLEASPSVVACDSHPRYNTTITAHELGLPVIEVQHHYAHILSCMAENDCIDKTVIGVSLDGTGYGTDETIWGGEILLCDIHGFRRCGSIAPFWQRGGDASSKEGWRIAVSMIAQLVKEPSGIAAVVQQLQLCDEANLQAQLFMAANQINSVRSTSTGRLFDAVSAILGLCRASTFEGEGAMKLQFAAERGKDAAEALSLDIGAGQMQNARYILPTDRLVQELLQRRLQGEDVSLLAYQFHDALAKMLVQACERVREETHCQTVALSGGVFQNTLLLRLCDDRLQGRGFTVLKHSLVPPNDGGIALGQAVYAMYNKGGI